MLAFALALSGCVSETEGSDSGATGEGDNSNGSTGDEETGETEEPPPASTFEAVRQATVEIFAEVQNDAGQRVQAWIGTGSIVDPSGLILTNAHVAAPEAPGLEILYAGSPGRPIERTNPDLLEIGMYVSEEELPDFRYRAEVVTAEGWLDLAVLRIVADAEGNPISALDLPTLELGDSDLIAGRDELTIVGYPDVGGATISTVPGSVGGFLPDDKIDDVNRGWIKTTATIRGGNSGGVGVNANLELIGVPTRGGDDFGHLRPINLAKPLIAAAQSGESYVRGTGIVFGSGQQAISPTGWTTKLDSSNCPIGPGQGLPSGIELFYFSFDWSGFTPGEDVAWQWMQNGRPWYVDTWGYNGWNLAESGSCEWLPAAKPDGSVLPDGTYGVVVYAGETLRQIANETVTVGGNVPTPDEVTLEVRLLDGDTRQPLADGYIVLLVPGTDPVAWYDAEDLDKSKVVALARTPAEGFVALNNPIDRGVEYPWVVQPPGDLGYRLFYANCCYTVPDDETGDLLQVNFTIRKPAP